MANSLLERVIDIGTSWYDNRVDTRNQHQAQDFNAAEAERSREFTAEQANIDRQMQREFAENGIRMRVNDAVEAGLNPLVAAGVTPMQYSPVSVGSAQASISASPHPSHFGQDISRALQATRTKEEEEAEQLKLDLLKSQIDESDARAGYYNSLSARQRQSSNSAGPFPAGAGQVQLTPDKKVSQSPDDPSRTAGSDHPFFKRYEVIPGLSVDVPYSEEGPAEGMEGLGALTLTILRNLIYRPGKYIKDTIAPKEREKKKYDDGLVTKPTGRW